MDLDAKDSNTDARLALFFNPAITVADTLFASSSQRLDLLRAFACGFPVRNGVARILFVEMVIDEIESKTG